MQANFSVICPCYKRSIYLECEYGSVTPCYIYLGGNPVGIIESDKTNYYLSMPFCKIPLRKTYLEAIYEAEEFLKKHLNIFRHDEIQQTPTKDGSICFYGDWFGIPYDNYHKIITICRDDKLLEIKFDHDERLLIYKPEDITDTAVF